MAVRVSLTSTASGGTPWDGNHVSVKSLVWPAATVKEPAWRRLRRSGSASGSGSPWNTTESGPAMPTSTDSATAPSSDSSSSTSKRLSHGTDEP